MQARALDEDLYFTKEYTQIASSVMYLASSWIVYLVDRLTSGESIQIMWWAKQNVVLWRSSDVEVQSWVLLSRCCGDLLLTKDQLLTVEIYPSWALKKHGLKDKDEASLRVEISTPHGHGIITFHRISYSISTNEPLEKDLSPPIPNLIMSSIFSVRGSLSLMASLRAAIAADDKVKL
jgi:hypothetical protein